MTDKNTILGLKMATDPRWADIASMSLEYILSDHAYCEQKAATQCISIIQKYPEKTELIEALAPIVTEEWGHFRMVLAEIKKRNFKLGRQRKDEYVNKLLEVQKSKKSTAEFMLLDKLLICGLIEARSCERFRLLSENIEEDHLKTFYHKFMVSEAGHYKVFLDLSRLYFGEELTKNEWKWWLNEEKNILQNIEVRPDRMH